MKRLVMCLECRRETEVPAQPNRVEATCPREDCQGGPVRVRWAS